MSEPASLAKRSSQRVEQRVQNEPALVLHSYPYKETSLLVEVFTRHYGRVALVARGAKRPRSVLRGTLLAFRPLHVGWVRPRNAAAELYTLSRAEWLGGIPGLAPGKLVSGFYLNELLMRLLPREAAHESLFDAYLAALHGLAGDERIAQVLRRFEYALLRDIGYALALTEDAASGEAIRADAWYEVFPERGPIEVKGPRRAGAVRGQTLLHLASGELADEDSLVQAKLLMRQLLGHHLGGQALHTRQMLIELNDL